MGINVYVTFNGTCRQAVEFYADAFKTEKPQFMTFGESPQNPEYPLPEEAKDLIMHTRLTIKNDVIMFSDTFPGSPVVVGNNISLAFVSDEPNELNAAFEKLKQGGHVSMELQETFFSKCYGKMKDQFGIEWQISHEE
ncbi:VOC family protein [Sporosarcina sp. BI001-red]|uniref:VOC family protein n=1 Tax=Sporosarcina sp. BI001-red TaxID=2282866 RepID=UPI000E242224|nr:VOC family protein [Sporosarcina sp. BI001-red]REB06651.1 VOC family protein [Sporosarcina sp. BI001-red]